MRQVLFSDICIFSQHLIQLSTRTTIRTWIAIKKPCQLFLEKEYNNLN